MTYQEIIQAIGNLPTEQQDSLIELIREQQVEQKQNGSSDLTPHFDDSNKNGESTNDRSIYRAVERTPQETAEGLRKIEKLFKRQQDLWNNMTEEEREISNAEFLILHEDLTKSRG